MTELKVLFIQESADYSAAVEQLLSSDGISIRAGHISDSANIDALSGQDWHVIIGEEHLLRTISADIDSFIAKLRSPSGGMPLIVVTNHNMATAHFISMSSLPEIVRKDNPEELVATIRSFFRVHYNLFEHHGTDGETPVHEHTPAEQILLRTHELKLANKRLLAEIHERRKAEIALKRTEEQLLRSRDELEKRVAERTADLARSEKESRELFGLLDKVFSSTNMLIAYLDTDLKFVRVNKAFAEVNGQDASFFAGRHYLDICPGTDHISLFRMAIETGESRSLYEQAIDFPALNSPHQVYWDWYIQPSTDDAGTVDGLMLGLVDVTDRVQSARALREGERRLTDAQRIGRMGSWVYDVESETLECSDEFFRIYDMRKRKHLSISTMMKQVHPDDRERIQSEARTAIEEERSYSTEHRIIHRDGSERTVEVQFELVRDKGALKQVRGVVHDITQLRGMEKSLRDSEERLRTFIDSATDSFMLFDSELNLIDINAKAAELVGRDRNALLGRHIIDIIPGLKTKGQFLLYREVLETGVPAFFDYVVENSGDNKYFYQQVFRAGDDLGIIYSEITNRKRYENTLISKQRQLELMLRYERLLANIITRLNAPGSFDDIVRELLHSLTVELHIDIAFWAPEGNHTIIEFGAEGTGHGISGESMEKLLARYSANRPGQHMIISDIRELPDEERRFFKNSNIKSLAVLPVNIGNKQAGHLCLCNMSRHDWQGEEYLLSTAADIFASAWERQMQIRARIEAEQQRIEALRLTEKVSRMASIGEIAGGITHEINQPLTAIKVSADSIRFWNRNNDNVLPEKFITMVEKISLSVDRISEIVRHMRLFWVSPGMEELSAVDLNSVVEKAMSLLNSQLRAHEIKPVIWMKDTDIIITGNPIHLEQILINLLVNSMNALDRVGRHDKIIEIVTGREDDYAILTVADNGTGLPAEAGVKIFDPFYSTRKPGEGTGLGLAITKRFVEAHRGVITAGANKPRGAVFTVRIPLRKTGEELHEHPACR